MIRRWWRNRRTRPQGLSSDHCRICDERLPYGKIYEVRSDHEDDPETGGGTFLAITYCKRHAPKGAVRC